MDRIRKALRLLLSYGYRLEQDFSRHRSQNDSPNFVKNCEVQPPPTLQGHGGVLAWCKQLRES